MWKHGPKNASRRRPLIPGAALFAVLVLAGVSFGQDKKEPTFLSISKAFKLSGWTQFQYVGWDKGVDNFSVRRSRLTLAGDILKKMHYKLQIDFAKTPTLLDAIVEVEFSQAFQLRVGQFLVPFSLENLTATSDVDMINRSQPEEKLAPGRDNASQGRDVGVAVFGNTSIVEYTAAIVNGAGFNKADTNSRKDLVGRVVLHPLKYLSVGGSFYKGKQSAAAEAPLVTRDKAGLELALVFDRASLKSEFYYAKDDKLTRNGWYVQGGYFVLPKKVQALVKYDVVDMDRTLSGDRVGRTTAGVNWFLSGRTKLQLNYELYKLESGKTDNQAILAMLQVAY
ncbi:MAG: OprO/OprP family phosphate-selective porin [Candidatus Aminicenantes bacterium]|nr:OprO/OprP family phosphate-selective porin [Candidatus Aminicenantes bacterium]